MALLYNVSLDELIEFDVDVKEIQQIIDRASEELEEKYVKIYIILYDGEVFICLLQKNKGFPGVGTVWMAVSIPGFFALWKSAETGQLQKIVESPVDGLDIRYVVEAGLIKGMSN